MEDNQLSNNLAHGFGQSGSIFNKTPLGYVENQMWSLANKMMVVLTLVVCVSQIALWFNDLPEQVPSHFDGNGQVDGHMNRVAFCSTMGLMNLVFLIGFPLLGLLTKYIPDSLVNMPNKDYWLAPNRRDNSMRTMTDFLTAIGWMTSWLFIGIFQMSALVAVKARETINPEFYLVMGIYLVVIVAMVVFLHFKFRIPTDDVSTNATDSFGPAA